MSDTRTTEELAACVYAHLHGTPGDYTDDDPLDALDTLTSRLEALEAVAQKASLCCIAMSDEGEPIDLCVQVGENADGPLYAIVDEVETWARAQDLLAALADLDAHDHAERVMGQ